MKSWGILALVRLNSGFIVRRMSSLIGKLKVINLFGGPGAGKSKIRAGLFNLMKEARISCEEVTEYAKGVTWDNNQDKLSDQLYIFAKQNRQLERLRGKVEWVISDSPLLLSMHYRPLEYFPETFGSLVKEVWSSYENVNFFIDRVGSYDPVGRNQTEEEAEEIDQQILDLLLGNSWEYSRVDGDHMAHHELFKRLRMSGLMK